MNQISKRATEGAGGGGGPEAAYCFSIVKSDILSSISDARHRAILIVSSNLNRHLGSSTIPSVAHAAAVSLGPRIENECIHG